MIRQGILNPDIAALIRRVRHTNTLVISDRGFPFWPTIETVDISLVDDIPSVLDVLKAVSTEIVIGKAWMAEQFKQHNSSEIIDQFSKTLRQCEIQYEDHDEFKKRVPHAIGLIRTGDTTQYANMIIESA